MHSYTLSRYPSSTLFPFLFWGQFSLLKLDISKKGTLAILGLLGSLAILTPKP